MSPQGRRKNNKFKLRIRIENFGMVSRGEIELRPLTIFIGPNNSGKSYTAMLIHSILQAYKILHLPFPIFRIEEKEIFETTVLRNIMEELDIALKEFLDRNKIVKHLELPSHIIHKIIEEVIRVIYEQVFQRELIRLFACEIKDLIKINSNNLVLEIADNSLFVRLINNGNRLVMKTLKVSPMRVIIKSVDKTRPMLSAKRRKNLIEIEISTRMYRGIRKNKLLKEHLVEFIAGSLIDSLFTTWDGRFISHYLPAARSGILQGYKTLTATIMELLPFFGIRKVEIPQFSGIVSDFISSLIRIPERKGPLYSLALNFEKEIIFGEIRVTSIERSLPPEIKYVFQGKAIPLYRASSTVSELAPLIIYLKFLVKPGDIIIIEEPEAHLHPENQRILAKYIVRLIRKGIYVLITTHSEFLLEQLNNFIMFSKVSAEKREKYGYLKDDYIKPDEVSAYLFEYDAEHNGYEISKLRIGDEGIMQEEFLKVHRILYEELLKLRRDLGIA